MFKKVLIANRGEIACRIIRTLRPHGRGAASPSTPRPTAHACMSRRPARRSASARPPAAESYLKADAHPRSGGATGAEAIHPGYGFLCENPDFAEACAEAGIVFIGPSPEQMRAFGLKHTARELADAAGVPLAPGTGLSRRCRSAQPRPSASAIRSC